MIRPKNCKFTSQVFDYGHKTGTTIDIKIGGFWWRNSVMGPGPTVFHMDKLLQQFWRRLGAQ